MPHGTPPNSFAGGSAAKKSSGKKVTRKQQAIAIGLSEARRAGAKVPKKKSAKKK